jgi:hypothetical protein
MANYMIDVLKDKNAPKELLNSIVSILKDGVRKEIKHTIEEKAGQLENLNELIDSEEWLEVALVATLEGSNAYSSLGQRLVERGVIDRANKTRFDDLFRKNTRVKIDISDEREFSSELDAIETKVEVHPGSANTGPVGAEELFAAFAAAYSGGEVFAIKELKKQQDDESSKDKPYILNAMPGFNDRSLGKASEVLQNYFIEHLSETVEKRLDKELKEELKKYKK